MTPCTVAHQAPLSIEFSRQEYWSGLPFPSPDLPDPGIQPGSPELKADSLPSESPGKLRQIKKTKPMRKALWWAAEWSLILPNSWKGWGRRKVVEFLMVSPILTPSLIVPNGWRWLEGAGALPLAATVAKTQRDLLGRSCWLLILVRNPCGSWSLLFLQQHTVSELSCAGLYFHALRGGRGFDFHQSHNIKGWCSLRHTSVCCSSN